MWGGLAAGARTPDISFMKTYGWLIVLVLAAVAGAALAANTGTDGKVGLELSQKLYCQMKSAFASPTGLFVGACLALVGLWRVINANVSGGVVFILAGVLITAAPSISQAFLGGIGAALGGTIATKPEITPPNC